MVHAAPLQLDEPNVDTVFDQPFVDGIGFPRVVHVQDQADFDAPLHGLDQGIAQVLRGEGVGGHGDFLRSRLRQPGQFPGDARLRGEEDLAGRRRISKFRNRHCGGLSSSFGCGIPCFLFHQRFFQFFPAAGFAFAFAAGLAAFCSCDRFRSIMLSFQVLETLKPIR